MLDVQLLMLPCRHSLRLGDVDLVRLPMPNRSKPKQVGRQGGGRVSPTIASAPLTAARVAVASRATAMTVLNLLIVVLRIADCFFVQ